MHSNFEFTLSLIKSLTPFLILSATSYPSLRFVLYYDGARIWHLSSARSWSGFRVKPWGFWERSIFIPFIIRKNSSINCCPWSFTGEYEASSSSRICAQFGMISPTKPSSWPQTTSMPCFEKFWVMKFVDRIWVLINCSSGLVSWNSLFWKLELTIPGSCISVSRDAWFFKRDDISEFFQNSLCVYRAWISDSIYFESGILLYSTIYLKLSSAFSIPILSVKSHLLCI